VEHRRVQAPSAARATGELDDGAHAGARGPRRLGGERREPRHLPPLAPQGRRLATGRVPVRSRGAKALLRVDRRPAPAPQHLERADARRERLCAGLPRAARAGQAHAEGRRMGAHHDHDAAHGRARRARRRAARRGPAAAGPRRRRHAAEAPLAARARPDPVSARHAASLPAALLISARLTLAPAFFRTAFFAPVVTTLVAVAVVWRYLLHTRYGLLNYALAGIGIHPIDWLGDPHWALPAIILFAVWKHFGYHMVILIAALQTIPAA